ncbi:hypothetical protein, partial [Crateriforma conspicua]|uniref:hypothetical protein n=1 Tax=Crateriforma conspicua TaxID=2527996 RepID=UPI001E393CD3
LPYNISSLRQSLDEPCDATEPGLHGFHEWKVNFPGPLIADVPRLKFAICLHRPHSSFAFSRRLCLRT